MKSKTEDEGLVARAFLATNDIYSKMSHPERLFYNGAYILLQDCVAAGVNVEVMLYEWITFNIPGGRYTPDFMVMFSDGSISFVEIKQEAQSKSGRKYYAGRSSYRDSRSKLRAAAELNPWFRFYMGVYNTRVGWRLEQITPGRGLDYVQRRPNGGRENDDREVQKTARDTR